MSLVNIAVEKQSNFTGVPIIDLQHASDPTRRRDLAKEIRDACIDVGFLYVRAHGISEEIIDDALSASKEFFALPLESKLKLDIRKTGSIKGYNGILRGKIDPDSDGDLHEGLLLGYEDLDATAKNEHAHGDFGDNVWPDEVPHLRSALLKYYHSAVTLGKALFPLFALALDLPETFFDDKTKNSAALMRVLHYPPQTGPIDDRISGIGAHTDWECFTILWQEPGIRALQVLNAENKWIDAPPIPGTLLINLGDQFARWTNDVFRSTRHRAINRTGVDRYSMPLFFGTDYDVRLEPIPSCVSPDRPPKYDVVTAGDHVKSRAKATYGQ
ncbi:hypothetical protein PLICRDRAFT_692963 [Plicaturopsis crispa FD-325 SS-3]|nr:hypothetical protein PLICRDRAFT_692963 [Plicaturopsis crispa FD-325 SS-3]